MFTGLVEAMGRVADVREEPPGRRLVVDLSSLDSVKDDSIALGESIAINGCCLTVVRVGDRVAEFEAGPETLRRTTLGRVAVGSLVNIERSLKVGSRLGGHFVSGHVDGLGMLARREDAAAWSEFWFEAPRELANQMASKGSIAVDGVSLTLVDVADRQFSVALIPHTLAATTLGQTNVGDVVNIETDLLAKYVEAQMTARRS